MMRAENDAVDVREIGSALRYGIRWIVAGALVGLLVGGAATLLTRPTYQSKATILLRAAGSGSGMVGLSSGSSDEGGVSLGSLSSLLSTGSAFDTELEILTSRSVLESVVDSLGLQAQVLEPRETAPFTLFAAARYPDVVDAATYRFERAGDRFRVEGPGARGDAVPGVPYALGGASVTLRTDGLPASFTVRVVGREEAIRWMEKHLLADRSGGDVAEVSFRARDRLTASAVPNLVVARYLERRKTTDRGINQHRYEFLTQHADSLAGALAVTERGLREYQEATGVVDAKFQGEGEYQRAAALRGDLERLQVESRGLEQLLATGRPSTRDLAAYPTLLRNGAINNILSRLLDLETQRSSLLDRRTPEDPDVVVLSRNIAQLEQELVTLSRAYLEGLGRQEAQIRSELGGYRATLDALPQHSEELQRRQREVRRLSETLVALQTHLVQTRLAAIGEGGEIRPVDLAVPPRKPKFPIPMLNLAGGLFGGVFFGMAVAVASAYRRPRIRSPWEAELAAGTPAVRLDPGAPLLLGGLETARTVLVVPVGPRADARAAAEQIVATAALQGRRVVFADLLKAPAAAPARLPARVGTALTVPEEEHGAVSLTPVERGEGGGYLAYAASENGNAAVPPRVAVEEMERQSSLVVAALPGLQAPATAALLSPERPVVLVVRSAEVVRPELEEAAGVLRRMGVRVVGVVVEGAHGNGSRAGGR
jgi:uncharacterized protein involved in exopolysaccharide biosynthesis